MSSRRENGNRSLVSLGDVVLIHFPVHWPPGHEQEGVRPAVVVALPWSVGSLRFPVVFVVPLTRDRGQSWVDENPSIYIRFSRGTAELESDSVCLLDQLRAVGLQRFVRYFGSLNEREYQRIRRGLSLMFNSESLE